MPVIDLETVRRCFAIAERLRKDGNPAVVNAIYVSYLEHLDFRGRNGPAAFKKLPPGLLEGWQEINRYMEELLEGNWERKGPRPD